MKKRNIYEVDVYNYPYFEAFDEIFINTVKCKDKNFLRFRIGDRDFLIEENDLIEIIIKEGRSNEN